MMSKIDLTQLDWSKSLVILCHDDSYALPLFFEYEVCNLISNRQVIRHPKHQGSLKEQSAFSRSLASLLGQDKIFLVTHSDMLIREINILCMIKNHCDELEDKFLSEFHYDKSQLLNADDIVVYDVFCGVLSDCEFDSERGFQIPSMDEEINRQNRVIDSIIARTYKD